MSIHSLHIASNSLLTAKLQIEITSRNIAGAQDPNYTRQSAIVKNLGPGLARVQGHTHQLGVTVEGFDRTRDSLLDKSYRLHHREAEGSRSVDVLAERLESALGEGSGLTEASREIRLGLLEVANHPDDSALRADLYQKLENLTDRFQSTSRELSDMAGESEQRVEGSVDRMNEILGELADINRRVPKWGKTSGKNALLDQRDALVDELSGYAEVRTVPHEGGGVAVYLDGRQLLFDDNVTKLALNTTTGDIETESGQVLQIDEGIIGNLRDFYDDTLPGFQQDLDTLAQSLISDVNAIHQNGYGLDGVSGRDLFQGTRASDIELAIPNQDAIAAASSRMASTDRIHNGTFASDQALSTQSGPLNTAPAASGSVDINGTVVAWNDTQDLDSILNSFSAAGVIAEFDEATGKVLLQRDPTQAGPPDITISDVSGNLSQVLNLDTAVSAPAIPGDGAVLRSLHTEIDLNTALEDRLTSLETQTGSFRRTAQDNAERAGLLEADAISRRDSVSAVSTDEELLALERYQQSFAAAARVANVASEILTNVINLGRN